MNISLDHIVPGSSSKQIQFFWYDYLIFLVILVFSTSIGLYYGCFGSKQETVNKYLLGGKKMTALPIALSIAVGHFSSLFLTGVSAEVYKYGVLYVVASISLIFVAIIAIYFFLIVFTKLEITSTYEYLELRFDKKTKLLASLLWIIAQFLPLSLVLYTPSLALSQATGFKTNIIGIVICTICTFYTTIGGLKTIVWTDICQLALVLVALTVITTLGITSAGGIFVILNKANEGERLDIFNFNFDPTKRHGFLINLIGIFINWAYYLGISQSVVQKVLALPSFKDCIRSVLYYTLVLEVITFFVITLGLLLFEKYADCDPLLSNKIQKHEQMLPYYVMDIGGNIPGLAGLFLVALCCASLSTISSSLNALSGVIYKDFLSNWFASRPSDKKAVLILKLTVVICGFVLLCLVTQMENMRDLFSLAMHFDSIAAGPLLGMFTLGLLFPKANTKGAFFSAIISLIYMAGIILPSKFFYSENTVISLKHLSVKKCPNLNTLNTSENMTFAENVNPLPIIFRLSHYYNITMSLAVTIILGLIISYCTNKNDPPVDQNLISPVVRSKNINKTTVPLMEKSSAT